MAIKVATLIAEVTARTSDFDRKMSRVDGTMQRTKTRFASLGKTALVAGTAVVSVGSAFLLAAKKAADYADEIDKTSERTGISRQRLQELQFVGSQLGVEFGNIEKAVKTFNSLIPDLQKGTSISAQEFQKLGVSLVDGSGQLKKMSDLFPETLKALSGMANETERNAIALKIFGARAGSTLFPVLNAGTTKIEELTAKAHELGLVMSDDAVRGLVKFKDKMDEVQRTIQAGLNQAIAENIDLINDEFIPALQTGIPVAIGVAARGLTGLFNLLNDLSTAFGPDATAVERLQAVGNLLAGFRTFDIDITGKRPDLTRAGAPVGPETFSDFLRRTTGTTTTPPPATDTGTTRPDIGAPFRAGDLSSIDIISDLSKLSFAADTSATKILELGGVAGLTAQDIRELDLSQEQIRELGGEAGFTSLKMREVAEVSGSVSDAHLQVNYSALIAATAMESLEQSAQGAIIGIGYAAAQAIEFGEGMGRALAHIAGQIGGTFIGNLLGKFTPLGEIYGPLVGEAIGSIAGALLAGRRDDPATPVFNVGPQQPLRGAIGVDQVQFVVQDNRMRTHSF